MKRDSVSSGDEVQNCSPTEEIDSHASTESLASDTPCTAPGALQYIQDIAAGTSQDDGTESRVVRHLSSSEVLKNYQRLVESGHQKSLITPKLPTPGTKAKKKPSKKPSTSPKLSALQLIEATLYQWKTGDSVKFITNRSSPGDTMAEVGKDFEHRYRDMCRKVDSQELEVAEGAEEVTVSETKGPGKGMPGMEKLQEEAAKYDVQVKEFYGVKKTECNTGASDVSVILSAC